MNPNECPLCVSPLSVSETKAFRPCPCGYVMCHWCWHRIVEDAEKDVAPRCPACRADYDVSAVSSTRYSGPARKADGKKQALADVVVRDGRVVGLAGLPPGMTEDLLVSARYLGQYGRILSCVLEQGTGRAAVRFCTSEEAGTAVAKVHGAVLQLPRAAKDEPLEFTIVSAALAPTRFCSAFLRGKHCRRDGGCVDIHEAIKPDRLHVIDGEARSLNLYGDVKRLELPADRPVAAFGFPFSFFPSPAARSPFAGRVRHRADSHRRAYLSVAAERHNVRTRAAKAARGFVNRAEPDAPVAMGESVMGALNPALRALLAKGNAVLADRDAALAEAMQQQQLASMAAQGLPVELLAAQADQAPPKPQQVPLPSQAPPQDMPADAAATAAIMQALNITGPIAPLGEDPDDDGDEVVLAATPDAAPCSGPSPPPMEQGIALRNVAPAPAAPQQPAALALGDIAPAQQPAANASPPLPTALSPGKQQKVRDTHLRAQAAGGRGRMQPLKTPHTAAEAQTVFDFVVDQGLRGFLELDNGRAIMDAACRLLPGLSTVQDAETFHDWALNVVGPNAVSPELLEQARALLAESSPAKAPATEEAAHSVFGAIGQPLGSGHDLFGPGPSSLLFAAAQAAPGEDEALTAARRGGNAAATEPDSFLANEGQAAPARAHAPVPAPVAPAPPPEQAAPAMPQRVLEADALRYLGLGTGVADLPHDRSPPKPRQYAPQVADPAAQVMAAGQQMPYARCSYAAAPPLTALPGVVASNTASLSKPSSAPRLADAAALPPSSPLVQAPQQLLAGSMQGAALQQPPQPQPQPQHMPTLLQSAQVPGQLPAAQQPPALPLGYNDPALVLQAQTLLQPQPTQQVQNLWMQQPQAPQQPQQAPVQAQATNAQMMQLLQAQALQLVQQQQQQVQQQQQQQQVQQQLAQQQLAKQQATLAPFTVVQAQAPAPAPQRAYAPTAFAAQHPDYYAVLHPSS